MKPAIFRVFCVSRVNRTLGAKIWSTGAQTKWSHTIFSSIIFPGTWAVMWMIAICVCVSVNPILNGRTHLVFSHHLLASVRKRKTDTNKKCIQEKGQGHTKTVLTWIWVHWFCILDWKKGLKMSFDETENGPKYVCRNGLKMVSQRWHIE